MSGNAVLGAAEEAEKAWRDGRAPGRLGCSATRLRRPKHSTPRLVPDNQTSATATWRRPSEVSVDTETGHVRVDRVTSTHDVGRAINPALVRGQVEGAVVQAHGYVMSENLVVVDGRIMNPRLSGYLIPGIGDIPEHVESVILELG